MDIKTDSWETLTEQLEGVTDKQLSDLKATIRELKTEREAGQDLIGQITILDNKHLQNLEALILDLQFDRESDTVEASTV